MKIFPSPGPFCEARDCVDSERGAAPEAIPPRMPETSTASPLTCVISPERGEGGAEEMRTVRAAGRAAEGEMGEASPDNVTGRLVGCQWSSPFFLPVVSFP